MECRGERIGTTAEVTVTVTSPARVHRARAVVTASRLLAPPYLTLSYGFCFCVTYARYQNPQSHAEERKSHAEERPASSPEEKGQRGVAPCCPPCSAHSSCALVHALLTIGTDVSLLPPVSAFVDARCLGWRVRRALHPLCQGKTRRLDVCFTLVWTE